MHHPTAVTIVEHLLDGRDWSHIADRHGLGRWREARRDWADPVIDLLTAVSKAMGTDHWRGRHHTTCAAPLCRELAARRHRHRRSENRGDTPPLPDDPAAWDRWATAMVAGTAGWHDIAAAYRCTIGWARTHWEQSLAPRWAALEEAAVPTGRHGTANGYRIDGCRGPACTTAVNTANGLRRRDHAYGRPRFVPAGPVADHIRALATEGVGTRRLHTITGVATSTISALRYGERARIGIAAAEKILAVNADQGHRTVDSTHTVAAIDRLVEAGWTKLAIARTVVSPTATILHIGRQPRTSRANHDAIVALLDTPWPGSTTIPPPTGPHDRIINADGARALLAVLAGHGIDPAAAARRLGLPTTALTGMGERTTQGVLDRLRELLADPWQQSAAA